MRYPVLIVANLDRLIALVQRLRNAVGESNLHGKLTMSEWHVLCAAMDVLEDTQQAIQAFSNGDRKGNISPNEMARYYGLMGDRDHTFEWLEKGYAERSSRMEYIKMEDYLEPFRSDPRYIDLVRRMGLPQ